MALQWHCNEREKDRWRSILSSSPLSSSQPLWDLLSLAHVCLSVTLLMRSTSSRWAARVRHTEQVPWSPCDSAGCCLPIFGVWLLRSVPAGTTRPQHSWLRRKYGTSYWRANPRHGRISAAFHCGVFTFSHRIHFALLTKDLNYSVHTQRWPQRASATFLWHTQRKAKCVLLRHGAAASL